MDRNQAWEIVCEFVKSESLRKHMLAVETCVAAYARKFGEDEQKWSVTALLHDFDWEIHPEAPDHPMKGEPILAERGVAEEIRRAILSHANYSGVPRVSPLEKTLFACDELAGFLTACSYVKPGRSVREVEVRRVRKKMKDKAFARSVNRDDIIDGAAELGVPISMSTSISASAPCRPRGGTRIGGHRSRQRVDSVRASSQPFRESNSAALDDRPHGS